MFHIINLRKTVTEVNMPQIGFHQLPRPLQDHRPRRYQRYVTSYSEPQHQAFLILPRPGITITLQADPFLIREEHRAGPVDVTIGWRYICSPMFETRLPACGGVTVASGPVVDSTKNGPVDAVEVDTKLERQLQQRAVIDES